MIYSLKFCYTGAFNLHMQMRNDLNLNLKNRVCHHLVSCFWQLFLGYKNKTNTIKK